MDTAPEPRYAAYPRPTYGSQAKLKELADGCYSYAWLPWLYEMAIGWMLIPGQAVYYFAVTATLSVASFVMTFRSFRKIAHAKGWSISAAFVAGFISFVNIASQAFLHAFANASGSLLLEFLTVGVLLIVVPNVVVKREFGRYGLVIPPFRKADVYRGIDNWTPAVPPNFRA